MADLFKRDYSRSTTAISLRLAGSDVLERLVDALTREAEVVEWAHAGFVAEGEEPYDTYWCERGRR